MAALEMTFECDNPSCESAQTVANDAPDAIKEDLEVDLLEEGWWIIRTWAGEKTYCCGNCLAEDITY